MSTDQSDHVAVGLQLLLK